DVEQLLARQSQLVLELIGQELAIVRELAVDPACREPGLAVAEDDVVLVEAELQLTRVDPSELLQRSSGDDRLELRHHALRACLLDREAIRVRGRHHDLARLEPDKDPRQYRTALVARCGASD